MLQTRPVKTEVFFENQDTLYLKYDNIYDLYTVHASKREAEILLKAELDRLNVNYPQFEFEGGLREIQDNFYTLYFFKVSYVPLEYEKENNDETIHETH